MRKAAALLLSLFLLSCKRPPITGPSRPGPTPVPTPTPVALSPLHVEGERFVNARGEHVQLLGGIGCCSGYPKNGWPMASDLLLSEIAAAKGNYVHIRLGPFTEKGENAGFVAYRDAGGGMVDLSEWNPDYWQKVRSILSSAGHQGIYVEVDIIDGWLLKHPELHPWAVGNNIQTEDQGDCRVLDKALSPLAARWVEKVLDETASFPNVIYQVSNESGVCKARGVSEEFEFDVMERVRRRGRLVGTNSHDPFIESRADFINYHQSHAPKGGLGKPVMVNEHDGGNLPSPAEWEKQARTARERGTAFHLWRGNMNDVEWADALSRLREIVEEGN